MNRTVNKNTIDLLKSYDFRINKNSTSFYKIVPLKNKKLKIRISNHCAYNDFKKEILINYIYKNQKDFYRIFKKIIKKYNLMEVVMEVAQWK